MLWIDALRAPLRDYTRLIIERETNPYVGEASVPSDSCTLLPERVMPIAQVQ